MGYIETHVRDELECLQYLKGEITVVKISFIAFLAEIVLKLDFDYTGRQIDNHEHTYKFQHRKIFLLFLSKDPDEYTGPKN